MAFKAQSCSPSPTSGPDLSMMLEDGRDGLGSRSVVARTL